MKIKIERFWNDQIKEIMEEINDSLNRMEIEQVHLKLKSLFKIFSSLDDPKIRVSLCFALEKIAQFEPFFQEIINFLAELLEEEVDSHVKEFAVYIIGNLVLEKPNLALITRTLPIFLKFCKDSSEYVRTCAEDIKKRLDVVKETKIKEREVIDSMLKALRDFIDGNIEKMNDRATQISEEALNLDYEAAFHSHDRMVEIIHQFSEINESTEAKVRTFIKNQIKENPIFEGESREEYTRWKNSRAEKEDLIRQIHCILRIQGKIFKIIQYIKDKGEKERISIEDIKKQTKGGLKGQWSDEEIIETLKKLVEEEIVPNLLLQQVKDLKGFMNQKKKPDSAD